MRRVPVALVVLLAFIASLAPSAVGAGSGVVLSQVYAGGGKRRRDLRQRLRRAVQPGQLEVDLTGWTIQYAPAAGTSWQTTALSGSIRRPLLPRSTRLHGRGRRGTAGARRDRNNEPRRVRRQGRARHRCDRPFVRCHGGRLFGGFLGPRPGRLRRGDGLRGKRRRRCTQQHAGGDAQLRGLHGLERQQRRLLCGAPDASELVCAVQRVCRLPASDRREHAGRAGRRRRSGCALDQPGAVEPQLRPGACRHDAAAPLRGGHRRRQPVGRLCPQRAPVGIHARRPAARRRVDRTGRRPDRPRARRRRARRDPDRACGRRHRRDDVVPERGRRGRLAGDDRVHGALPAVPAGHYAASVTFTVVAL